MYDCSGTYGTSVANIQTFIVVCVRTADEIIDAKGNDPNALLLISR